MPRPPQYSPSNLKSIHLLRALLREATYLPDANSRSYFRQYIVNRFKAYQPRQNATNIDKTKGFSRRAYPIIAERTRPKQRKAQKGLNYLRRANLGERPCLEKVLLMAYGRVGKRRHDLLAELLELKTPAGTEPMPLQQIYYSDKRFLQFFDAPKRISEDKLAIEVSSGYPRLQAVLKSQSAHGIALGRDLKGSKLTTSRLNVWARPMPIKRARNDVRRWYAETMSKLLPPLPNNEWDRLRALATGEEKWNGSIPRRTPARPRESASIDDLDASKAIFRDGLALDMPSRADFPRGKSRPHNLTQHMMRRLYANVLRLSCKTEWDEERNKWIAIWGTLRDVTPKVYTAPVDDALFAGVDATGRKLATA